MIIFSRHVSRFSFDYFISHYPIVFYVCVGVVGFLVFFALILAPLLIWRQVAKMRREMQNGQKGLSLLAQALKEELEKVNALGIEMQQRYLKTMQYVCDRLADICDGVNGIPSDSAPPPAPNLMPDSAPSPAPSSASDSVNKQPRNDVAKQD